MLIQEKPTHHPSRLSQMSSFMKLSQIFSVNRDLSPSTGRLWFIPFILDLNHKKLKLLLRSWKSPSWLLLSCLHQVPKLCLIPFHYKFFSLSQHWIKFQSIISPKCPSLNCEYKILSSYWEMQVLSTNDSIQPLHPTHAIRTRPNSSKTDLLAQDHIPRMTPTPLKCMTEKVRCCQKNFLFVLAKT